MTTIRRTIHRSVALGATLASAALGCKSGTEPSSRLTHPTGTVRAEVSVSGRPFAVAISRAGVAYVSLLDANALARYDLKSTTLLGQIAVGIHPSQVRIDEAAGRAYVGNQDTPEIGVVDLATNRQVTSFPSSTSVLTLGLSADGASVYSLTDFQGVKVLDARDGHVLATIPAGPVLTGVALNSAAPRLYAAARDGGTVTVIDTKSNAKVGTYATGGSPQNVAVSPDGAEVYVTDIANSTLQVWSAKTGTRVATVPVGSGVFRNAFDVAVTADGAQLWVSGLADGKVYVFDRRTRAPRRVIDVGGEPRYIAFDATGAHAVIANEGGWISFVD